MCACKTFLFRVPLAGEFAAVTFQIQSSIFSLKSSNDMFDFLCASYSTSLPPSPSPVLTQWHIKDPGHSAKSSGGRLHLNTHAPLTQRTRNGLNMPLSGHNVGTYPETSSHATCQETFGHGCLSSLSHCGLILA